jgi:hypothetical protein
MMTNFVYVKSQMSVVAVLAEDVFLVAREIIISTSVAQDIDWIG